MARQYEDAFEKKAMGQWKTMFRRVMKPRGQWVPKTYGGIGFKKIIATEELAGDFGRLASEKKLWAAEKGVVFALTKYLLELAYQR
ncbi:hypothetical protein ABVK25_001557 [Lepraria finkii]|uniref:Uncharacterized protein n=1 Tax=Lepraria finkii TaxID=1340010 RepID=A0ABR4BJN8_9LECA